MGFIQWVLGFTGADKREEVNVEAEIERKYSSGLLLAIESLSRKIGMSGAGESEYKPVTAMRKIDISLRLKIIFRKLKELEEMQKVSINAMIKSMKSRMDPLAQKDLDFDLRLERKMETQTLNLETFLDSMLAHFEATGDRRYAYSFLNTAAKVIRGEIREEKEIKKIPAKSA